ncbi:hypothetical protein Halha_1277 [Halobacteroides halobius DSM 5150]|uniref:Galactosyltransferase C-terminal domain-containing protein n=1 Tax=Halobacteroides halobius (strain ATCC 35273 / DSM 5150 / MD-1) TaxID=748449 RepID=L0KAV7_HALHC|nr:galactosyltransferase-related protein [Halobacteroides halobius]AGB41223.1 hypothetical protein Halha_1277 [Halobacteroides halobius DSM 5150]
MLDNVSVLIPYWPDCEQRARIFKWTSKFYERMMPKAELCIGELNCEKFSRAQAINLAAQKATRDIFLIADIDLIYAPQIIIDSISLLDEYPWVLPFQEIVRFNQDYTEKLLSLNPKWPIVDNYGSHHKHSINGGGLNLIPRQNFETVGGFDERFIEWGGEDDAFTIAMTVLCGQPKRLDHTLYHLWHPRSASTNYKNNIELLNRYCQGGEKINEIIKERKDS